MTHDAQIPIDPEAKWEMELRDKMESMTELERVKFQLDIARRRHDSVMEGVFKQNETLDRMRRQAVIQQSEIVRLQNELMQAQQTNQMLGTRQNEKLGDAHNEVRRLREVCLANNIDPDSASPFGGG